jgi:hypothetical protein
MPTTSRRALEETGVSIIEQRTPAFLLNRSVLVTGEVDRTTGFEKGHAIHQAWRGGSSSRPSDISVQTACSPDRCKRCFRGVSGERRPDERERLGLQVQLLAI